MTKKALIAYCLLLIIIFFAHAVPLRATDYLLPLYMIAVPLILGRRIKCSFSLKQITYTLLTSLVVLLPIYVILSVSRQYHLIGTAAIVTQFARIAVPEEIFFRGFLQETLGNNVKGIVLVSLLFAVAHLPALFFYHNYYALLTFFPSLVMGFLYMKTSSILPPVLFHFLANVVFRGFMI
jgi:hypothetical protein